jgi:hypothetical protein
VERSDWLLPLRSRPVFLDEQMGECLGSFCCVVVAFYGLEIAPLGASIRLFVILEKRWFATTLPAASDVRPKSRHRRVVKFRSTTTNDKGTFAAKQPTASPA